MTDERRSHERRESVRETVSLRQHIEAILDEQRRGLVVAEQEREKSARALRAELERSIQDGDQALRDHVTSQVEQIRAALQSSETLEVERIEALRREMAIINEASETAIAKAEAATDKRLQALNELRSMVTDAQQQFMPREVADAQLDELRRAISELAAKVGKLV